MRFYGLLFGHADVADSLFCVVERNYCSLRDSALQTTARPTLLTDLKTGAAWYVPGGCSTTGRFYTDAGANYLFADFKKSGAVPLAFETVFERANNADFWLFKYNRATDYTYTALAAENDLYTQFSPFNNRQIYGCNTDYVPYYDEVPFRPDWFLRDLVRIFHPELLPDYKLRYFSAIEE
jgi:iron complex transport system substrate-binding protein